MLSVEDMPFDARIVLLHPKSCNSVGKKAVILAYQTGFFPLMGGITIVYHMHSCPSVAHTQFAPGFVFTLHLLPQGKMKDTCPDLSLSGAINFGDLVVDAPWIFCKDI